MNTFLNAMRPGVPPAVADTAAMKRLVFDSQTLTIANLRNSMMASLNGPLEPSYWLYDSFQL